MIMVKSIHVHTCAQQITIKLNSYTCVCALLKAKEDYVAGDEARPSGVVQNICPDVGERAPHRCHRSLPLLLAKRLPEQRVARRSPVGHARKGSVIRLLVQREHVRIRRERPSLTRVRERGAQLARAADGSTSATANEMRIVSVAQVVVSIEASGKNVGTARCSKVLFEGASSGRKNAHSVQQWHASKAEVPC